MMLKVKKQRFGLRERYKIKF